MRKLLLFCLLASPVWSRAVEIETSEVTQPDLTISPDGRTLVFNILGHLFSLPATESSANSRATQLTFGPSYDSEPMFSPDGRRIAFVSDRDGSDGNIFVLDLASKRVTQITRDFLASSPVWSNDGRTIAYFRRLRREDYPLETMPGIGGGGGPEQVEIRTISANGGRTTKVGPGPRAYGSLFYLADGRLGWTVTDRVEGRLRTLLESGTVSIATVDGSVGRVISGTDGLYYATLGGLRKLSFTGGPATVISAKLGAQAKIAVTQDSKSVYAGDQGKLLRFALPNGTSAPLQWTARVAMEIREREPAVWSAPQPGVSRGPRAILTPRLSPDGQRIAFMAAGAIWEQTLAGNEPAKRLIDEPAFQVEPAYSPDGKLLAYTVDDRGRRQIRVYDFSTRQSRTLATFGGATWPLFLSWSPDGRRVIFQRTDAIRAPYRFVAVDISGGEPQELAQFGESWTGRPHLSQDGKWLYFTARRERYANFYRLALTANAKPEPITNLTRHVHDGQLSPDGRWLAFRRNTEIWLGHVTAAPLTDRSFRLFSEEGGRSFQFTPDSSAIHYSEGPHVFRQPVRGGKPTEIPIRLTLTQTTAPPVLIRRARVVDARTGKASAETSLLIENGRIKGIGDGFSTSANPTMIDAQGRFAIPGVFDFHVHSAWANQQISEDQFIAYGVTSVRDTGSRLDLLHALEDRGESMNLPVPRYFYSGEIFEGLMPLWGDAFLEITTPEEARTYVRRFKKHGANFIKVYPSLSWNLKRVVVDEAHRQGLPIVGHGLSVDEIVRSISMGFTTLEHSAGAAYDDVVKLFAASGTLWDPTLTVGEMTRLAPVDDPGRFTDAKIKTFVPADDIAAGLRGGGLNAGVPLDQLRVNWKARLARVAAAYKAGVKLMDGTDALMTGVYFGPSLHWSLSYFEDAGIPSADILRIATMEAAALVGAPDLGTIEPGKLADLVLVEADPTGGIQNATKVWRTIINGRVYDPEKLR